MEAAEEAVEIEHHELQHFAGVEARSTQGQGSFLSTLSVSSCVITYTRNAKTVLYILLLITCVPIIVGAAFTSIFTEDGNYNAAVWAFFTGCMSVGTCSLYTLHLFGKLEKYHDNATLEGLKVLGMIFSVISGIAVGVYTILSFLNKQAFALYGLNYFSSAIFGGLCIFSSIQLVATAQYYQNALRVASFVERTNAQTSALQSI
ncbi:uncharacterized protein LOC129217340 [Uloborus diversus]|uniref:uncharacterized protein LOC129217340 n=1 Tax=Uloborus diversus TaxID=327109 RepID=UPI00240A13BF|nr:uncharacterized protein LOC129217340 [Uloborus diversus]